MRRILALLPLTAALLAQQAATPPQAEAPKTARLEGMVRSVAGSPIARATLRLQGPAAQGLPTTFAATSDDEGKFAFENVPPGRNYRMTAQRAGFVNAQYGARSATTAGTPLTLAAGQVLKDLVFEMIPQGVITGRITDRNGDPVVNAMVMTLRSAIVRGVRQTMPGGSAGTNDQGEYRIANLAPGRYFLSVSERNNMIGAIQRTAGAAEQESNLTTYYTNASELRSAVPIEITPGAELRGIDVRLLRGKSYTVRGRVVDPAGAAPQGQLLLAALPKEDAGAGLPAIMLTRSVQPTRPPDATFEFSGLTPGVYVLTAAGSAVINGQPSAPLTVRAEVTVTDKDVNDLVVRATSGASITGTVRLEDGDIQSLIPADAAKPAAGAAVALAGVVAVTGVSGRLTVLLADTTQMPLNGPRPGQVQTDGSFKVEGAGPSRYRVNVNALPDGVYVKSVTYGGQDATGGVVDLTSGAGGELSVVLSPKAADITGAVRDDKGEAQASVPVTLWPRTPPVSDPTGGIRSAISDQNGGFQIRSIPPGEYYLAAWESPEAVQMLGPELLAKFTADAAKVDLGEAAHHAVEAKPIPAEKLAAEAAKLP